MDKGATGVNKFALVASASTTSIASSVKKRKKERRLEIRSNPEEQQRTRDIRGDFLYLRDPRQILPICFSEPCPKIHDTTTSTSVRKAQCKDAKWPCKELSRRPATARRFPERVLPPTPSRRPNSNIDFLVYSLTIVVHLDVFLLAIVNKKSSLFSFGVSRVFLVGTYMFYKKGCFHKKIDCFTRQKGFDKDT